MKEIIDLLNSNDFYGVSKTVDTAKGLYKLPYSWKQLGKTIKRIWKSKN